MTKGGARNRSGPQKDPNSGRSEASKVSFTALPGGGFTGRVPKMPLADATKREMELWRQAWRTPQAAAWSVQPWRHYTVAQWVRWSVRAEASDAPASTAAAMIRLADQIGMTPAGLKENGWAIAPVAVPNAAPRKAAPRKAPARRLRAVPDAVES